MHADVGDLRVGLGAPRHRQLVHGFLPPNNALRTTIWAEVTAVWVNYPWGLFRMLADAGGGQPWSAGLQPFPTAMTQLRRSPAMAWRRLNDAMATSPRDSRWLCILARMRSYATRSTRHSG